MMAGELENVKGIGRLGDELLPRARRFTMCNMPSIPPDECALRVGVGELFGTDEPSLMVICGFGG